LRVAYVRYTKQPSPPHSFLKSTTTVAFASPLLQKKRKQNEMDVDAPIVFNGYFTYDVFEVFILHLQIDGLPFLSYVYFGGDILQSSRW
jgi:hypothetical protein